MNYMLTITTDGLAFDVEFDRWDNLQHDRARFMWRIWETERDANGRNVPVILLADGSDLTCVMPDRIDLADAMGALASFLGAWAEAQGYEGSENADLFPRTLLDRVDAGTWQEVAFDLAEHLGRA